MRYVHDRTEHSIGKETVFKTSGEEITYRRSARLELMLDDCANMCCQESS